MARHVLILVVYARHWVRLGGLDPSVEGTKFVEKAGRWSVGPKVTFAHDKTQILDAGVYILHYAPNNGISCAIAGMAEAVVIEDGNEDVWPLPPYSLPAPRMAPLQPEDPWPTPPPRVQVDAFQTPLKKYVKELLLLPPPAASATPKTKKRGARKHRASSPPKR